MSKIFIRILTFEKLCSPASPFCPVCGWKHIKVNINITVRLILSVAENCYISNICIILTIRLILSVAKTINMIVFLFLAETESKDADTYQTINMYTYKVGQGVLCQVFATLPLVESQSRLEPHGQFCLRWLLWRSLYMYVWLSWWSCFKYDYYDCNSATCWVRSHVNSLEWSWSLFWLGF